MGGGEARQYCSSAVEWLAWPDMGIPPALSLVWLGLPAFGHATCQIRPRPTAFTIKMHALWELYMRFCSLCKMALLHSAFVFKDLDESNLGPYQRFFVKSFEPCALQTDYT